MNRFVRVVLIFLVTDVLKDRPLIDYRSGKSVPLARVKHTAPIRLII